MSAQPKLLRSILAAVVLAIPLAGCSGIFNNKTPTQIIMPQVQVEPDPSWPQVAWQLTVMHPSTNDMLDSRRMAVSPSPGHIEVYKGVAWNNTITDLVQDAVVQGFEDSGKVIAVGHQTSGLNTDFALQIDIRDYQAVYHDAGAPPDVLVTINARLINYATSRAIASHTFRQVVPASGTGVPAVAHAFDTALGAVIHDLIGWTLSNGQQAKANAAAAAK